MKAYVQKCAEAAWTFYVALRLRGRLPRDLATHVMRKHNFCMAEAGCWLCLRRFSFDLRVCDFLIWEFGDKFPVCGKKCKGLDYVGGDVDLKLFPGIIFESKGRGAAKGRRGLAQRFEHNGPLVDPELSEEERLVRIQRTLEEMRWSIRFLQSFHDCGKVTTFEPLTCMATPHQMIAHDIQLADIANSEAAREVIREKEKLRARLIAEERDRDRQRRHIGGGRRK